MVKNTNIIKKANQALVLDAIKKNKKMTTEEIIAQTGLSRTTVLTIIKDISQRKLVEKSGRAKQAVGRQPALYSLSQNEYFVIGIDVDVAPIYLNIARIDGESVYYRQWTISNNVHALELADSLVCHIETALKEAKIDHKKIVGLGLGLPGILDIPNNTAINISRVEGWKSFPIADMIREKFGFETYVRNDTHLLGYIEITPEQANILYILHRSGIGMAPIIDGEVYEGAFGNSGYIGHTRIESKGKVCKCGAKDCLELYCSKRSIEKGYKELTGAECSYDELIDKSVHGDDAATKVFKSAGNYFGIGVANAIKTYDILDVVIGDLRCDENHTFFRSIVESVKENTVNFCQEVPNVSLSSSTKEIYGMGGCQFVLDHFFEQPKLHTQIEENGGDLIGTTV